MLSLGEQQRLTFARVLVARPVLAILDEVRPIQSQCIYLGRGMSLFIGLTLTPDNLSSSRARRKASARYSR